MTPRQAQALANPLNAARGDISPFRVTEQLTRGLLVVILAVDR